MTLGGASSGDRDLIKPALAARGLDLDFWKIALRPGKPLLFGRLGAMMVLGLPGNPVSSFITFLLFVRPFMLRLQGVLHGLMEQFGAGGMEAAGESGTDAAGGTNDGDAGVVERHEAWIWRASRWMPWSMPRKTMWCNGTTAYQ